MAPPAASAVFVNNLGTLTINHCLIELADEWTWTNAVVRHAKRVRLTGMISRQDAIDFGAMSTNLANNNTAGLPGALTLPWTVLDRVLLQNIEMDPSGGTWLDWVPVALEFADHDPERNRYIIDFFGVPLINCRFAVQLPYRAVRDEFVSQPMGAPLVSGFNPAFGAIRTLQTNENMRCALSGTYQVDPQPDLEFVLERLVQRGGTNFVTPNLLPSGWPRIFNMQDLSPKIALAFPLTNLWVTEPRFDWDVERGQAEVTIQMECPPQL